MRIMLRQWENGRDVAMAKDAALHFRVQLKQVGLMLLMLPTAEMQLAL